MTSKPGNGGGYGGWTPPSVPQQPPGPPGGPHQPGAGGPVNAYGQPVAPPVAPPPVSTGYGQQPGTNAYGQPAAGGWTPPSVPQHSGAGGPVNAYGQPVAPPVAPPAVNTGYGQQPGANAYGQAPATAKNRKPLIIGGGVVIVVVIALVAAWTLLGGGGASGPDSAATAGEAVKGYLQALSRGDAKGALAYSDDQPASTDLLTDDVLKQQIAKWPITNIRILSDDSTNSSIGYGQVHVAANFGDKSSDVTMSVKKTDGKWRLGHAAIKLTTDSGTGRNEEGGVAKTLTIFDKAISDGTAYVFPGYLEVGTSNPYLKVEAKPVLLDQLAGGGSTGSPLQATYTVTDAAKTAIMAQVKTVTDACTNSHAAVPPKPCDAVAFGVVDGTVNWGSADLSRIKIDNIDTYSGGLTVRVSGQAFFNNVTGTDMYNGGGIKTLNQQSMYINGTADLSRTPLTVNFR